MTGRPEVLWPLFSDLKGLNGVGPKTAALFANLGVENPKDLALTLPTGGIDRRRLETVQGVLPGQVATVEVTVLSHQPATRKGRPHRVTVEDAQTTFTLIFFHVRGGFLEKLLPVGGRRVISGKVEHFDGVAQIAHPDHIVAPGEAGDFPAFEPVYPLTSGVTQKLMFKATHDVLARLPELGEWIEPGLLAQRGWPSWTEALRAAHRPQSNSDLTAEAPARMRLAYDEMLAHQLTLALARQGQRRSGGRATVGTGALQDLVRADLPFSPTGAQLRTVAEIAGDMAAPIRMSRLLQGDVGAGKTLVALMALLIAVEAGGQGVLMAPTEILARQHVEGLRRLAKAADVRIEGLTGRDNGAARAAKLAALADGSIGILVGTHAVFQKDVHFADLRLAVIDEQHRFGVRERAELGAKGDRADVLVMTATPIPRSLALANYGDMDVSVLDEKPAGRTPVTTALISIDRVGDVVERLRAQIEAGAQAYWVCPLVEESENVAFTAAEERFKRLRAALGEGAVGLVHGQLPAEEKDKAMARFVAGETKVLVATTVIEVGVDVPNASIMVVENAERFGLAQLHQLRGRVGRGAAVSTCLLVYQGPLSDSSRRRLETLRESEDGFRIAEEDLALRGAGDVIGTAQSGLPRFRVADLERQTGLMETALDDARLLIETDPELKTPRGTAARLLLWLMEQDRAIGLISVG